MEYMVVSGYSLQDLVSTVNQYLTSGWTPQGGIASTTGGYHNGKNFYYQALIRE